MTPACLPAPSSSSSTALLHPMTQSRTNRNLVKDPIRYKTVMCANWARDGSCPYGFKCQFAHGRDELRGRSARKAAAAAAAQQAAGSRPTEAKPAAAMAVSPSSSPLAPPAAPPAAARAIEHSPPPGLAPLPHSTLPEEGAKSFRLEAPHVAEDAEDAEEADCSEVNCSEILRCNRVTGKVELALPPGVTSRQASHTTNIVRRQISSLFSDELESPPVLPKKPLLGEQTPYTQKSMAVWAPITRETTEPDDSLLQGPEKLLPCATMVDGLFYA